EVRRIAPCAPALRERIWFAACRTNNVARTPPRPLTWRMSWILDQPYRQRGRACRGQLHALVQTAGSPEVRMRKLVPIAAAFATVSAIVAGENNPVKAARKLYGWTLANVDYWVKDPEHKAASGLARRSI